MRLSFQARRVLASLGPFLGLAAVWLLFYSIAPQFASWDNHRLMLLQTTVVAIAAVGATAIIISGGIDLSVGSTIALGTMVVALLLQRGVGVPLAAIGGILTGVACGALIGALVVGFVVHIFAGGLCIGVLWYGGGHWQLLWTLVAGAAVAAGSYAMVSRFSPRLVLSPFIVTLGMWGALRGAAKGLGDSQPIYPTDAGWLPWLMTGDWPYADAAAEQAGKQSAFDQLFHAAPPCIWLLVIVAVAVAWALRSTVLGRRTFAIGGNEHAARICGVPVNATKVLVYALGVGCAGIASVLQFGYLSVGDPTTASGYELKVIAAVVIGGASLSGGVGSVTGTIAGALIMTAVDNGCTKLHLDNWVQEIVTGGIILAAVALDRVRRRER